MVLHPMERPTRRSNQKPPVTFFLFLRHPVWFSDLSSSCCRIPLLLSSLAEEASRGNTCLIIYAAPVAWNFTVSYIILAHIFLYTWTHESVTWGTHMAVYSQEETGRYLRYMPLYMCTPAVRASSVRELLLVGFLGHARQIPLGYIFWVFPG